jgi:hypothetical protein
LTLGTTRVTIGTLWGTSEPFEFNLVPTITTISPTSKTAGQPAFPLTVNGTNFVNGSVVTWNNSNRTTTYVNSTQLTASIPASDITSVGTAGVTVFNPAPGGGTSTPALTFTINNTNPVPTTTSLSPTSKTAGQPAFPLTVNGTNFVNGSVVTWNNSNRTTTYVNSTQLTASIPASDITSVGTAGVTVFNPAPGGGTSTPALTFTINNTNPVPTTTSLSPTSKTAGQPAFTLTVNGTNFVNGSVVTWNNSNRTTTYVNSTQLTASITAADIATAGTASVTVYTPTPGGGTSNAQTFTITKPPTPPPTPPTPTTTPTFYFAEGTTRANFQEYLCLGNSGDKAASAQVTYLFTDGTTKDASYTVPANSRKTVDVNSVVGPNKDLSLKVLSDSPNLVAERPMYFNYNGVWTGGSDAVGATAPNTKWYFAEGNTLPEFDQYVTVLNPGSTKANLTFHYMVEGQGEKQVTGQVGPHSRKNFKTRDQIGDGKNVSLYLESDQPVVAERPMYFNYQGLAQNNWTGGHDVVGTNSPNTDWYFAEGTTRKNAVDGAFEQWLCLQNPGTKPITVTATYQLAAGQGNPISKSYTVPAQQRLTVPVNNEIGPDKDCSVYLHSDSNFIAERPMYFSYHASAWTGGHDVLGVNSTASTWFFAEGTTRTNFEEWLCLQNPGNSDAHTTITYYTTSGQVIPKQWTVKANTRLTVSANTDVGANQDISSKVSSDKPIIVERPMYFNFQGVWTGGHDVVGFVPSL